MANCSAPNEKPTQMLVGPWGLQFVLIPEGEFLLGSLESEGEKRERPQHKLYLPSYYVSVTPVTNAQWGRYLQSTGKMPPQSCNLPFYKKTIPRYPFRMRLRP